MRDTVEGVTVIVPVWNRAGTVREAVTSALEQSWPDIEVVVVDDGSTDESSEQVRAIIAEDSRVRLLRQSNSGPSAARNRGLAEATTRLVTFLDSDDLMLPDRVEKQMARLLASPRADLVIGAEHVVVDNGAPIPRWVRGLPPADVAARYYTLSMLVDKSWLDLIGGFDESIWIGEDVDLLVRLRSVGARIATIDDVVLVRRIRGDNLIYAEDDVEVSLLRALRRHLSQNSLPRAT